ncbi:MAG: amidase [Alphaproteobacteria bacterium]|nr:amidase [Alphaproteobacteria bacterium]
MLPAATLVRLYRMRQLSPVEATRAALARIEAGDPVLNAFIHRAPEEALAAARESEARWMRGAPVGLVDGVPTSIKDQWLAKGWPTLRGTKTARRDGPWDEDSPAVARLREHGAVLLGKTNLPEFGWKGVTDSPLAGISRNPWDPSKTCGGSSGGAAIAAATGMGALHLGSDGAGSIRMPAGFSGVFGLKPTFARVPAYPYGLLPMCSHTGPMTRTVADAALMLNVMAEPDHRDWLAPLPDGRDYRVGLEAGVRGLRIAYSRTLGYAWVDPEIAALTDAAARVFADLGAAVEEVDPGFADPRVPFEMFYATSIATTLKRLGPEARAVVDPGYARMADAGARFSGIDLIEGWAAREAVGRHMNAFHQRFDLLLTPQLPLAAFAAGLEYPEGRGMTSWFDWSPFTYPFNWTGQPAASVPCGLTPAGLPAAIQIVGPRYGDALVLQASRAYESAVPFAMPGLSHIGAGRG